MCPECLSPTSTLKYDPGSAYIDPIWYCTVCDAEFSETDLKEIEKKETTKK